MFWKKTIRKTAKITIIKTRVGWKRGQAQGSHKYASGNTIQQTTARNRAKYSTWLVSVDRHSV